MIIRPFKKKTCLNHNFYYSQYRINKPLQGFILISQSNYLEIKIFPNHKYLVMVLLFISPQSMNKL